MQYASLSKNSDARDISLSKEKSLELLQRLFKRLELIEAQCEGQFPLYSIGNSDQWVTSKGGSWTGGFWAGCWWMRSLFTESVNDERKALAICQNLNGKLTEDTINRSMIFWYGNTLGARYSYSPYAKQLMYSAADVLMKSYQSKLRCIPVGKAMGGGENGANGIVIDTLSPVLQLFKYTDNPIAEQIALNHMRTVTKSCMTSQGAWYEKKFHNGEKFIADESAGTWARGHAWGLLGLARAATYWGEPYNSQMIKSLEYWQRHFMNNPFPPNRLGIDSINQPDLSSMLIVSLAVSVFSTIKLDSRFTDIPEKYLAAIIDSKYLNCIDSEQGDYAIFWGANSQTSPGTTALVESTWGIYFLMLGLAIHLKKLDPFYV